MRHADYILKHPLVTEKSTWENEARNRVCFVVDMHATKEDIRTAVEKQYKVRVTKVRTQVRKGKNFRTRYGTSNTGDWKKAIVELHAEDKIDLI